MTEKQQENWKNQIIEQMERGEENQRFEQVINDLSETYDLRDIAISLLKIAYSDSLPINSQDIYDFGETGASKGMVRFFMNVGRNVNMSPQNLIKEISELVGIPGKAIGRIDIFDKFTFLEVPEMLLHLSMKL